MFTPFLGLPLPVLVQHQQVFFRRPIFGSGLCAGIRPLVREGEGEALADGLRIHFGIRRAAFHGGHGRYQADELFRIHPPRRLRKVLPSSQSAKLQYGADVALRVVFGGWCPSADDVRNVEILIGTMEMLPVRFQCPPGCPLAVSHRFELHERGVGLLYSGPLPTVGRVADVKRVVVALSSCHEL